MASRSRITPLRRADIPELSQFLISGFRVPATFFFFLSRGALMEVFLDGPSGPSKETPRSAA